VEKAGIRMRGIAMDPLKGVRFDALTAKGALRKNDVPAGDFSLKYAQSSSKKDLKTEFDITANDIDMTAVSFIYKDSLPVTVEKGVLDLRSKTDIVNGELDSKNSLSLKDQQLASKGGGQAAVGFIPMPILVEALNQVDPIKLKFDITGSVDSPKFSGFQDSLKELVKPYITDVKEQGVKAVGDFFKKKLGGGEESAAPKPSGESQEDTTQKAIDSIKSLFE
jgi:hypothetical protein